MSRLKASASANVRGWSGLGQCFVVHNLSRSALKLDTIVGSDGSRSMGVYGGIGGSEVLVLLPIEPRPIILKVALRGR